MKKSLLITLVLLFVTIYCYSTTITSTQNGEWSAGATWGGSAPSTEDTVIINHTVSITDGSVGTNASRANFTVIVNGTLNLVYSGGNVSPLPVGSGNGAAGMWLSAASSVIIPAGGQLNSSSNNTWPTGIFPVDYNFISIGSNWWEIAYSGTIDGTVDGPAGITSGGVLPIELISFSANLSGEVVDIAWATASEINNEFFTLERSVDGINWDIIGEIDGAGNSSERLDYRFIDSDPIPGLSYYRLKQTDFDGKFEYFTPSVVLYEPDNLFKVFPNPTSDLVQLTTSSNLENATIFIKDLNGQVKISRQSISDHQTSIDLSTLPTGVYLLEIAFPESVLSKRIVKN